MALYFTPCWAHNAYKRCANAELAKTQNSIPKMPSKMRHIDCFVIPVFISVALLPLLEQLMQLLSLQKIASIYSLLS